MTVATTERKQSFATNGVTVNFPFTFKATDANQIYCQYTPNGGNTIDYTNFTVVLQEAGGTVTTNDVLGSGTLLVYRIVPLTQNTDYVEGGRFPAESHEAALDKLTLIDQDQQEDISRALKGPIGKDNPYTLAETLAEDELLIMQTNEIKSSGTTIDDLNNAIDNANNAAQNAEKVLINLPSGQWAAGIAFNSANEFMSFNGVGYTPLPTTTFPYVTQGNDPTQAPDNAFVQPFSNVNSSNISTYTDLVFDSVDDAKSYTYSGSEKVETSAYYSGNSYGGAKYIATPVASAPTPDGFRDHLTDDGNFVLVLNENLPLKMTQIGFKLGLNTTGNQAAWNAAMASTETVFEFDQKGTIWADGQFQRKSGLEIFSRVEQGLRQQTHTFRSDTGTIGDGNPLFSTDGSTQYQGFRLINISVRGDSEPTNQEDLTTFPTTGFIAVDPSGTKEGFVWKGACRGLKGSVWLVSGHGYLGLCKIDVKHLFVRQPFDSLRSTTTADISGCEFYECFKIGNGGRFKADILTLNNTSASDNDAGFAFDTIDIGAFHVEGYGNPLQPLYSVKFNDGSFLSECFTVSGAAYYIKPQGNNCTIEINGTRIGTNTRLINPANITDWKTINFICRSNYGGSNFSGVADIKNYIREGLRLDGAGNLNSNDWNAKTNVPPTYYSPNLEAGVESRISILKQRINWTNSISFDLNFADDYQDDPSSSQSYNSFSCHVVGANNGAGGNTAYFARIYIFNAFGSTWDSYIDGPSSASYSVALTNKQNRSVSVEITESHAGTDDILVIDGSTANGKITLT